MKKEIIEKIVDLDNIDYDGTVESLKEDIDKKFGKWFNINKYTGFLIITNRQCIYILIENYQKCCENWGYEACKDSGIIETQDDLKDFIGAELISIESIEPGTHNGISVYNTLLEEIDYDRSEIAAEFVNIKTSNGLLQFAIYNCHNGYYGHNIYIVSNQINIKDYL